MSTTLDKNDGGPALVGFEMRNGVVTLTSQMTLRDYFAAKALPGMVSSTLNAENYADHIAAAAYILADAMLAERAK